MSFFSRNKKSPETEAEDISEPVTPKKSGSKKGNPTPKAGTEPDIGYGTYVKTFLGDVNTAGIGTLQNDDATALAATANLQAVSMMGEDARSYLQGMELIYTTATAKALEMIANNEAQGQSLLSAVTTSQTATGQFGLEVAACAEAFAKL